MSDEVERNFDKKNNSFIKLFWSKLKKIKHFDIVLTVLFVAIILLIYFSTFSTKKIDEKTNESNNIVEFTKEETDSLLSEYSKEVENKLVSVISQLKGVGNVSVAVKLNGDIENIYAYTTKEEVLENGTKVETKTPVLIAEGNKSTPLILQTKMPTIDSIVIIAQGAKNTNVKLDILRVVQLLYNLPSSKIEIFVGN